MNKKRKNKKQTPSWWLALALGNDEGSHILPIPQNLHNFLETIYWMALGLVIIRFILILLFGLF